ncbi:MAG TPA: C1 family peptidase [Mycobacteriales bacterium]|nr:C1 family peptidase [Mycobacteriales bacterium]
MTRPVTPHDGLLTRSDIDLLRKEFGADPAYRRSQNAVTQTSIDDIALDRAIVTGIDPTVSHLLDDWKVTNQKQSGRCWAFAGLNLIRAGAMKSMNLKDFEFSQNYIMFWDKLERANYFLESIIETTRKDADDRTVAFLLDSVLGDGGQWNMFVAVIRKHGLVPKSAMPETESSSASGKMNSSLRSVLRQGAKALRESGAGVEALREQKRGILRTVHRILSIHLGTPPERFTWQWTDKDREFHRDGEMTPQEFAEKYITIPLDDYVCLVDDPRPSSPRSRTFTVEYLGNVVGAPPVVYLNVDMSVIKQAAMQTIVEGEPVWFGCDVGKMMRRDLGIWDAKLFDFEGVYDTTFDLDKAARLTYHETQMTHAMLFTGVDVQDHAPRKWRVENSWGEENGVEGFYTMNDSWFGEHVFEIACRRDLLPAELLAGLDQDPITLPAWDPMGALAR